MKKVLVMLLMAIVVTACNSSVKKRSSLSADSIKTIPIQNSTLTKSIDRGELLYTDFCMQCHMANGSGVPGTFPPLAKSNWLTEKRTESIRAVKYGQQGEIEVNGEMYNGVMVPMGLTHQEIADVFNYIMNSWGNTQYNMVTEEEVSKVAKD